MSDDYRTVTTRFRGISESGQVPFEADIPDVEAFWDALREGPVAGSQIVYRPTRIKRNGPQATIVNRLPRVVTESIVQDIEVFTMRLQEAN